MKPTLKAIIVGAGGVASYMLPALANTFDLSGIVIDADILEEHNLDRQIFNSKDIGKPKAEALIKFNHLQKKLRPIVQFLKETDAESHPEFSEFDVVVCLVDNHPARRAALAIAERHDLAIVICANEYSTSQSMFWHPNLGGKFKPDNRYPEIKTSDEGSPIRCQGEALESTPQLAAANQISAAFGMLLLWLWMGDKPYDSLNPQPFYPIEYQSTFSRMETTLVSDVR